MEREEMETKSTARWKPTVQQKEILEFFYESGLHTQTTDEIIWITKLLKNYGTVEGKNVYFWFQNVKSRKKQLLRKEKPLELSLSLSEEAFQATVDITRSRSLSEILNEMEWENTIRVQEHSRFYSCPTLELFPLRPDHGGLEPVENTQWKTDRDLIGKEQGLVDLRLDQLLAYQVSGPPFSVQAVESLRSTVQFLDDQPASLN